MTTYFAGLAAMAAGFAMGSGYVGLALVLAVIYLIIQSINVSETKE